MYEIIKRHGETYVYRGQTCIAIATAEGEKAVEGLVQLADELEGILDAGFGHPTLSAKKVAELRALLGAS